LSWSFKPSIPIYLQIESEIKKRILEGKYPPGTKIPGVREIAEEAAVNPNTVQRAFAELENSGLITTLRTAGRYVTEDTGIIKHERDLFISSKIREFLDEIKEWELSDEEIIALIKNQF